ncbi:MAG: DNA topoisomerase I [Candidatus Aenigmarchaeota archaeon]|nr:DNA topoisomerase I [Candidatus Aenigmarchaeota archaeon]MDW8149500.1 DNA topoisomerase I [Candidatus Aenigmarchaeota archaeon]
MKEFDLIIAEKPKAAEKIARALSNGKYKVYKNGNFKFYEFDNYRVVAAIGHLFKLDTKNKVWNYPTFEAYWFPSSKEVKKYISIFKNVCENCRNVIIATDYDIEGDVIGYNILRFLLKRNNAFRAKFSALTESEIKKAFSNLMKSLDFGQVYAGLTRHYLDFFWGINLTRALTRITNNGRIISCGRVQTPTLNLILERENEIRNFVPKDFWVIKALLDKNGEKFSAEYIEGRIFEKEKAFNIYEECKKAKEVVIESIETKKIKIKPLPPFDLTSLQSEAYKFFRFSPSKTLKIAEELYLDGYITYPRTSSQKMPVGINLKEILNSLIRIREYYEYVSKILRKKELRFIEGKKEDPAHPAIIPTGKIPFKLKNEQEKIYDLIARRFMNCFYDDLIIVEQKIIFKINDHKFISVGKSIVNNGWSEVYEKKIRENLIPKIDYNDKIFLIDIKILKDSTKPPKRYNLSELVKTMESLKLGTKATRAEIIETLFRRNFISGKKTIEITKMGETLISVLKQIVPIITSVEMTRKFEEYMEGIMNGKIEMEKVLNEAKKIIVNVIEEIENRKEEIRKNFNKALTH